MSIDAGGGSKFTRLLDLPQPLDLKDPSIPDGWCNFWRQDDWSSTAYFYLDKPVNELPPLTPVEARVAGFDE